jgi:hypothetical protein
MNMPSDPEITKQDSGALAPDLERQKWADECNFRDRELQLRAREQNRLNDELIFKREEAARSRWFNPLLIAVVAAFLAALGNAAVSLMSGWTAQDIQRDNNRAQLDLEDFKAESGRLLEVIKTNNDPDRAAVNISFLLDAGLIKNQNTAAYLKQFLATRARGEGPALPGTSPVGPSAGPPAASPKVPDQILPSEPQLRVNAPGHIASVRGVATDRDGRLAVTASEDKTVRVWSLPDGKLLKVIWLPSGAGYLGEAYAVALSPKGDMIAVGGWTSPTGTDSNVYIFDRASGTLQRRLSSLPDVVYHLAYSPDGSRLAASLAGRNGIRVFDVDNGYQLLPSDSAYEGPGHWVDFDHHGRLASASEDGFVRLYAADQYSKPVKVSVREIGRPFSVAFSPDGEYLAVGAEANPNVAVLHGRDLALESLPDNGGFDSTRLAVAWSQDGQHLFAEGSIPSHKDRVARRWERTGTRWSFIDIVGSRRDVMRQFVSLSEQRMLFADAAGFGIIDAAGKTIRLQGPGSIDMSDARRTLRISEDARTVEVREQSSGRIIRFALMKRTVTADPTGDTKLAPAITQSDRIPLVEDEWKDTESPKLNGSKLSLQNGEMSRSVALVPGTDRFVLGAQWSLWLFDARSKEVWQRPVAMPSAALGVNVSADGKLIVAAYGDGTIRWHRVSDGAELLALFIAQGGQRWVAWTPQGYYDSSAQADDLIGWQVNHGYDQAPDFYPALRYQQRFNRRDVIACLLDALDVDKAVEQASAAAGHQVTRTESLTTSVLTPVVDIMDPPAVSEQSARELALTYVARSTGGDPILRMEALVDGVPFKAQDVPMLVEGDKRAGSLRFVLPLRDAKISVIAYNANGASQPASIQVLWRGPGREDRPTLYVLTIGISRYEAPGLPALHFPAKDAEDFVAVTKMQRGGLLYDRVVFYPKSESLVNDGATKENILDGLDWIHRAVQSYNDIAMVFLSGHGVNDTRQHYRFLPYDYDPNRLERTTIADTEFQQYIGNIHGKTVFFFDTCFSGNVLGGKAVDATPDVDRFANELRSAKNGVVVFASSTGSELSLEPPRTKDPKLTNSAFTWAVLDGLRGKAARQGVNVITLTDLNSYVAHAVPDQTFGNQHPTFAMPATVQDYPIASVVR